MLKAGPYHNAVKIINFKPHNKHKDSKFEGSFIIIIKLKWKPKKTFYNKQETQNLGSGFLYNNVFFQLKKAKSQIQGYNHLQSSSCLQCNSRTDCPTPL
jgi:hypothetical protein